MAKRNPEWERMRDKAEAARHLLTTVEALAWYIEHVNDDDPNRSQRFFAARETWRHAQMVAANAGVDPSDVDSWRLIVKNDEKAPSQLEHDEWRKAVSECATSLGLKQWVQLQRRRARDDAFKTFLTATQED